MRSAISQIIHFHILLLICFFAQSKAEINLRGNRCKIPLSYLNADLSPVCRRIHNGIDLQFGQIMQKLENIHHTLSPQPPPQPPSQIRAQPPPPAPPPVPRDCSDLACGSRSGVYKISPGRGQPMPAFCDMTYNGGGWTVIQRRADIKPRVNFFRSWADYKWGFGQLTGEFWWGLERVCALTSLPNKKYRLRIDLEDFQGHKRSAEYDEFTISPETDDYRLRVVNFSGSGEPDFGDSMTYHNGSRFSTFDREQVGLNAEHQCAKNYKGGWWYKRCHHANLNGKYLAGSHQSNADGVNWKHWRGIHYSLKSVEMKLRPMR